MFSAAGGGATGVQDAGGSGKKKKGVDAEVEEDTYYDALKRDMAER